MSSLSDREKKEDILFLSTAQDWYYQGVKDNFDYIISIVLNNFRCGTYNGELKNYSEVKREIENFAKLAFKEK